MTAFTLDTSGDVRAPIPWAPGSTGWMPASGIWAIRWPDLSPFVQGYVEAASAELQRSFCRVHSATRAEHPLSRYVRCTACGARGIPSNGRRKPGRTRRVTWLKVRFSMWSPEALALILRDCEAASGPPHPRAVVGAANAAGRLFWYTRQHGKLPSFPPLTPYLADDGKVCLKEAA